MRYIKEINIKNQTYYQTRSHTNLDKKSYKNIDIYYIGYITIKNTSDWKSVNSVNPLYFIAGDADGHIEGKNGNKYLVFDSKDSKEVLKKNTQNFEMGLKI